MGNSCSRSNKKVLGKNQYLFVSESHRKVVQIYLRNFVPLGLIESHHIVSQLLQWQSRGESATRVQISGSRAEGLAVPEFRLSDGENVLERIDVINNVGFNWSKIAGWDTVKSRLDDLRVREAVVLISPCVDNHAVIEPARGTAARYVYISDRNRSEDHASKVYVKKGDAWYLSSVEFRAKASRLGLCTFVRGDTLLSAWDDVSEHSLNLEAGDPFSEDACRQGNEDTQPPADDIERSLRLKLPFLPQNVVPENSCLLAYPLSCWPEIARGFLTRHRPSDWPGPDIMELIADLKPAVLVVPDGSNQGEEQDLQWRYCFTPVEATLANALSPTQRLIFIHLKLLRHFFFSDTAISAYCLRTVYYWELEHLPTDTWTEKNMAKLLYHLLTTIHKALMRGKIPDYFLPNVNLLHGKKRAENKKAAIKVRSVRNKLFESFLQITQNVEYFFGMGSAKADFHSLLHCALDAVPPDGARDFMQPIMRIIPVYVGALQAKAEQVNDLCKLRPRIKGSQDTVSWSTWDSGGESEDLDASEDREVKIVLDLFSAQFCVNNLLVAVCELMQEIYSQRLAARGKDKDGDIPAGGDFEDLVGSILLDELDLVPSLSIRVLLMLYVLQGAPLTVTSWQAWLFATVGGNWPKRDALFYESYTMIQTNLDLLWIAGLPKDPPEDIPPENNVQDHNRFPENPLQELTVPVLDHSEQSSIDLNFMAEPTTFNPRLSTLVDDFENTLDLSPVLLRRVLREYFRNDKWLTLPAFHNISLSLLFKSEEYNS